MSPTQDLFEYIKGAESKGKSRQQIENELINLGWSPVIVAQTFNAIERQKIGEILPADLPQSHVVVEEYKEEPNETPYRSTSVDPLTGYLKKIMEGEVRFRVLLSILLVTIAISIPTIFKIFTKTIPTINKIEQNLTRFIDENFPEELEITIKKGRASSNVTEPYFITISQSDLEDLFNQEEGSEKPVAKIRLLTINTKGKIEDFERYQSLAMLTEGSLVYLNEGHIQVSSLRSMPDIVINKKLVKDKINELLYKNNLLKIFKWLFYISPLLIIVGGFVFSVVGIALGSVLIWLMNKILATGIVFSKIFRLTAFLSIPVIVINALFYTITPLQPFARIVYTALDILILSLAYIFLKYYKRAYES